METLPFYVGGKHTAIISNGCIDWNNDNLPHIQLFLTIQGGEFDGEELNKHYYVYTDKAFTYLKNEWKKLGIEVNSHEEIDVEFLQHFANLKTEITIVPDGGGSRTVFLNGLPQIKRGKITAGDIEARMPVATQERFNEYSDTRELVESLETILGDIRGIIERVQTGGK